MPHQRKKLFGYIKRSPGVSKIKEILIVGASPLGLTLSPNIILIIINKNAILYGGARAVACYAVKKNLNAYILIYGELIGVGVLAGILLPPVLGIIGVWVSVPITQAILAAFAIMLQKRTSYIIDSRDKMFCAKGNT